MNKKLLLISPLIASLTACAMFPFEKEVQDGHFRVENFSYDHMNDTKEYVYLMCHNKKPTGWIAARQYPAGEHDLWVKATYQNVGVLHSYREAYVNFKMDFPEGGNYQLAHEINNENISVWLQDVETKEKASEVITEPLARHNVGDNGKHIQQCKQGTV